MSICFPRRIRRVKCDEQKPVCLRCKSSGRDCDGYLDVFRQDMNNNIQPVPLTAARLAKVPSYKLPGTSKERQAFDFFIQNTGRDLFSATNMKSVYQLMLQISHSDDAIRSAIVALGSTGEQLHTCDSLAIQRERSSPNQDFTRIQYCKALQCLQRHIDANSDHSVAYTILLCVLFCMFEFLQGNDVGALTHLKGGLGLLSQDYWRVSGGLDKLSPNEDLHSEILTIFSAMNVQAALWLGLDDLPSSFMWLPQPAAGVGGSGLIYGQEDYSQPSVFATIDQISDSLNHHTRQIYAFRLFITSCSQRSSEDPIFQGLHAEKLRLVSQFQQWPPAVDASEMQLGSKITFDDTCRLAAMKMNYMIINILLQTYLEEANKLRIYQESEAEFRRVLIRANTIIRPMSDLARLRIQRVVTANNMGINPVSVSLQSGVIAPIYYTAIKCQNLSICHEAIRLLSEAPWREGAWDSLVMANIAKREIRRQKDQGGYMEYIED